MFVLAVQERGTVYAYNEFYKTVLREQGELHQYTDSTVAIKRGNFIYIYGLDGKVLATYPYDFIDMSNLADSII